MPDDATHPPRNAGEDGRGSVVAFPRSRGRSGPRDNLPVELTTFVGREKEVAEVKGLLADRRLLTLTGPGGCGKTRLALAVATGVAESLEEAVRWVGLASLSDSELVPGAVASALGVREAPDRSLTEMLADYLEPRKLLLVLDNCEHLVGACAGLADALLRSCPKLKILATSREALGVAGEEVWPVPSLSLPDSERPPVEGLDRYEAVRLFVERARSVSATFVLSERNAPALASLCRRLDGIPLAIELAAARAKVLSVDQISSRLDDSFRLLKTDSRTALPRHQTLRATVGWSHDLLSEDEKVLFRRLSVFAGGFALEAAEEVCSGEEVEKTEVLDLLARLVDKSLVLVAAEHQQDDEEARYRLLETVRQYAAEKLAESEEATAVRRRHAGFFLALAEEAEGEARRGTWMERLEREHGNLRAALGWALESGEAELGLRLASALGVFWNVRGHLSEGRRWLDEALANGTEEALEPVRARALARAGWIAREQGDYQRSVALNEASLALARRLGDKAATADALTNLGWTALFRDELERASELVEEAIALQRGMDDGPGLASSLTVLGLVANVRHDYERAITLHEESLALFREAEDDVAIALSLTPGALAYLGRGDLRRAWELCKEGVRLSWRLKMLHPTAAHLYMAASLSGAQGRPIRAARLWGAAQALSEAVGISLSPIERRAYEPYVAAARAQLDEGEWETACTVGRRMSAEQAVEYALDQTPVLPLKPAPPAAVEPVTAAEKAPAELWIFALGPARVEREGHVLAPSEWTYAKSRELLYYLLSHPPRTRDRIGLDLWPDASPAQLRKAFHNAVYYLRKALGRQEWVLFEEGRYAFNRSLGCRFDAEVFESYLDEARRLEAEEPTWAIRYLEQAVGLYGGDFLEDFPDVGWAEERREELRRKQGEALLELGGLLLGESRHAEAADVYRRAIAHDGLSEASHRGLMRSLAGQGERGQALRHYEALAKLLVEEIGSSPAPETNALRDSLRRGEDV